jgi:hypothetical protein
MESFAKNHFGAALHTPVTAVDFFRVLIPLSSQETFE